MDHTIDFDDLNQVELAAQDASAAMLRYLIRQVERRMAREPEAHYLAPDLVIGEARPHAAATRRSRNAEH